MVNGKRPLYLTLLTGAVAVSLLYAWQPYSVSSGWYAYTKPAHRYLRAALREDSAALVRQSASPAPVAWALHAARTHPAMLRVWARNGRAWAGTQNGDTTIVLLDTFSHVCRDQPLMFQFVGAGSRARVLEARSGCLGEP